MPDHILGVRKLFAFKQGKTSAFCTTEKSLSKYETMNKWIIPSILVAGLIAGLVIGFILNNAFVVKPLTSSYNKQIDRKDELIVTLVKVPKNLIQQTLTVKKVKKGSSIYYVPSADLQAIEVKMDSLVRDFVIPEDTVSLEKETFWDKLKFWED